MLARWMVKRNWWFFSSFFLLSFYCCCCCCMVHVLCGGCCQPTCAQKTWEEEESGSGLGFPLSLLFCYMRHTSTQCFAFRGGRTPSTSIDTHSVCFDKKKKEKRKRHFSLTWNLKWYRDGWLQVCSVELVETGGKFTESPWAWSSLCFDVHGLHCTSNCPDWKCCFTLCMLPDAAYALYSPN